MLSGARLTSVAFDGVWVDWALQTTMQAAPTAVSARAITAQ